MQQLEEEVARLQQQSAAKSAELERSAEELADARQLAAAAEKAAAAKLRSVQAEAEGRQAELAAELGAKAAAAQRAQMEAEMAMHRRLGEQDQELVRRWDWDGAGRVWRMTLRGHVLLCARKHDGCEVATPVSLLQGGWHMVKQASTCATLYAKGSSSVLLFCLGPHRSSLHATRLCQSRPVRRCTTLH
jgi:hypothetical protein